MAPKLVIDSSVIVKWLNTTDEQNLENADKLLAKALEGTITLLSPELAKYEVGNVLLLKKKLPTKTIATPIQALYAFPLKFISESESLAHRTYQIADEYGITYYDASFMALAQQENATLVTDNFKHQGKDPEIKVVPLKDYPNKLKR